MRDNLMNLQSATQREQTQLNGVSSGAGEERQLWPMNESAIFPSYVGLAI